MEAKDTVMSKNKKKQLIVKRSHQQIVGDTQEEMLLEAQAEISFKAGMKEVLEWIKEHNAQPDEILDTWQAQLAKVDKARPELEKGCKDVIDRVLNAYATMLACQIPEKYVETIEKLKKIGADQILDLMDN